MILQLLCVCAVAIGWALLRSCSTAKALSSQRANIVRAGTQRLARTCELECSAALARMLDGYEFKKVRPAWLRNSATGRNLELDFYCAELNLAVEYNGAQHYEFIPGRFHRTHSDFEYQRTRDALKHRLCKEHGVDLIVLHAVPKRDIASTLKQCLVERGLIFG
jgi:hypothetical protein